MIRKILTAMAMLGIALCVTGCSSVKVEEEQSYTIDEVSKISADVDTWNFKIQASDDDEIHLSYEGKIDKTKGKINVEQKNGNLYIEQTQKKKSLINDFSFGEEGKIILKLPETYKAPIVLNNNSGDIHISGIKADNADVTSHSGIVNCSKVELGNTLLKSDSGDITLKDSTIGDTSIKTRSAYVRIDNTTMGNSDISTKSGEVDVVKNVDSSDLYVETKSGDITIDYAENPKDLAFDISSDSDDVSVDLKDAHYVIEREDRKQGTIGDGTHKLNISSKGATVVVK